MKDLSILADAIEAFEANFPSLESRPPARDDSLQQLMARLTGEVLGREVDLDDVVEYRSTWQVVTADAVFQLRVPDTGAWGRPELELLSFRCDRCGAHRHGWSFPVALVRSLADIGRIVARHRDAHAATAARLDGAA